MMRWISRCGTPRRRCIWLREGVETAEAATTARDEGAAERAAWTVSCGSSCLHWDEAKRSKVDQGRKENCDSDEEKEKVMNE